MSEVANTGAVDLFGDPLLVREAKRGRPAHERTARNANKVSLLFAMGYEVKDVAAALGITQPTLRKHYFSEVSQREAMRLKLEAEVNVQLFEAAKSGNVGAMKKLLDRVDRASLTMVAAKVRARGKAEPVKSAPIGKKEAQRRAAENVTGRFEPRQPPTLLIN